MFVQDLDQYIKPGMRCHMAGIGGVSMAPLSEVLHGRGLIVTGSDTRESEVIGRLRSLGITVAIGQRAENVGEADFLIRTAAVHDDNPEIVEARRRGIPVFERAQAWGWFMRGYRNAICVSGTHGKTTTTSMLAYILAEAGRDPTVSLGGTLPILTNGHRVGKGDDFVIESCEYFNSFLSFFPTIAVILNVDEDHLDFFKDLEDIQRSFARFASLVSEGGTVVCPAHDERVAQALAMADLKGRQILTFGLEEDATVRGTEIQTGGRLTRMRVLAEGEPYAELELQVLGHANRLDALAACTVAWMLGMDGKTVHDALLEFGGAARRFEYRGTVNGALVYDDYGHHPRELQAVMDICRQFQAKRLLVAFQPHTYSRTLALFDDFVKVLSIPDKVYLAEIYAARETNDTGLSSADLAAQIPGSEFCGSVEDTAAAIRRDARPGDLVVTIGAGDITKAAALLTR